MDVHFSVVMKTPNAFKQKNRQPSLSVITTTYRAKGDIRFKNTCKIYNPIEIIRYSCNIKIKV